MVDFSILTFVQLLKKKKIHINHSHPHSSKFIEIVLLLDRCLVKPSVPLLSFLKDHCSNNGTNNNPQKSTQEQQEDLPASKRCTPEVTGWIINIVCITREHKILINVYTARCHEDLFSLIIYWYFFYNNTVAFLNLMGQNLLNNILYEW